jgi:hypothetical protein
MVLPSDRLAFAAAVATCNAVGREARLLRLRNTLRLEQFWVSAALLDEVEGNASLCAVRGLEEVRFDKAGNLVDH